jgi:hypothetical protein
MSRIHARPFVAWLHCRSSLLVLAMTAGPAQRGDHRSPARLVRRFGPARTRRQWPSTAPARSTSASDGRSATSGRSPPGSTQSAAVRATSTGSSGDFWMPFGRGRVGKTCNAAVQSSETADAAGVWDFDRGTGRRDPDLPADRVYPRSPTARPSTSRGNCLTSPTHSHTARSGASPGRERAVCCRTWRSPRTQPGLFPERTASAYRHGHSP